MQKRRRAAVEGLKDGEAAGKPGVQPRCFMGDEKDGSAAVGMAVGPDVVGLERTDAAVAGIVMRAERVEGFSAERKKKKCKQQPPGTSDFHGGIIAESPAVR